MEPILNIVIAAGLLLVVRLIGERGRVRAAHEARPNAAVHGGEAQSRRLRSQPIRSSMIGQRPTSASSARRRGMAEPLVSHGGTTTPSSRERTTPWETSW